MTYHISYGSIRKGDYRLKDYLQLGDKKLDLLNNSFWLKTKAIATIKRPISKYKNYEFIANGWEWSVFKKDENTVVKIPAGIFPEINEEIYLKNSEEAYDLIRKYFPSKYISTTKFERAAGLNVLTQDYIKGDTSYFLSSQEDNSLKLKNVDDFLNYAIEMLDNEDWAPDINVKRMPGGYVFRGIIEDETFLPKIIDFTFYYDPYRIHPKMTEREVKIHRDEIIKLKNFISKKLK